MSKRSPGYRTVSISSVLLSEIQHSAVQAPTDTTNNFAAKTAIKSTPKGPSAGNAPQGATASLVKLKQRLDSLRLQYDAVHGLLFHYASITRARPSVLKLPAPFTRQAEGSCQADSTRQSSPHRPKPHNPGFIQPSGGAPEPPVGNIAGFWFFFLRCRGLSS